MNAFHVDNWGADWAWSLPLIVISVVIHVLGLGLVTGRVDIVLNRLKDRRRFTSIFAMVMSVTVTSAIILHAVEAVGWAVAYQLLGALPNYKSAMLYSLSAMTSYGNSGTSLPDEWRMMGALEALNGMLLFGLTTAFLFAMIQRVRPVGGRRMEFDP
jgi:hypothetical protein